MLYLKCPTCKYLLGDIQLIYEELITHVCKEHDIGKITLKEANKLKEEIVNSLGLERYCCKMRLLTYTKFINLVK